MPERVKKMKCGGGGLDHKKKSRGGEVSGKLCLRKGGGPVKYLM